MRIKIEGLDTVAYVDTQDISAVSLDKEDDEFLWCIEVYLKSISGYLLFKWDDKAKALEIFEELGAYIRG